MNFRYAYHQLKDISGAQAARWLLEHIASSIGVLELDGDLSDAEQNRFEDAMARLGRGEPIQYILGSWDFFGYRFHVDSRALIPRPETELLVEVALRLICKTDKPHVVDLGAGTGCIGIALKLKRPDARVALVDVSPQACSLSKENAELLKANVEIINCDMRKLCDKYDLILSNPPYIKTGDIDSLDMSVKLYEPPGALDGGEDGLDYYRELEAIAQRCLDCNGKMALEMGAGQRAGIEEIFSDYRVRFIKDLQGTDRITVIQK